MVDTVRVLFIGNSFTARNDLPGLVSQLVAAGDKGQLETELISAGGASLRLHLNKGEAQQRLHTGFWDYAVLQEQSTLPVKNPIRTAENIRDFNAAIKASGTQTVLYMTWARQDAPQTQDELARVYSETGREIGATVAPVGLAWQRCLEKTDIALHDKDKSHPNLAGSYLAACVFYATLFMGRSRSIPTIDIALDAGVVETLHKAASETVRAFKKG
ncbi:MAG: hypothetical protein GKR89_33540 [Candidatus Latescibacteria bacterium]|nr:hypothetical protein [Candidatus Latescibacterota bacterium]